jgi:hypothetical protein
LEQQEKEFVPPVVQLLASLGHPVVLSARAAVGFEGKGEFAIRSPATQRVRRADVVAARWNFDGTPLTVAVECKATVAAVYEALGQAADYQSVFDEVYIATPLAPEDLMFVRSTLVELGIGHITVGHQSTPATVTVPPVPRWPSRFQPNRRATVDCRLSLGLGFREVGAGANPRFGFFTEADRLGVWYAQEVFGHRQWNAWCVASGEETNVFAGINIEHIADIREIVREVDVSRLKATLAELPPDVRLHVDYVPNPRPHGSQATPVVADSARLADASAVLSALGDCPPKYRPQLSIHRALGPTGVGPFRHDDCVAFLRRVRDELGSVMACLLPESHNQHS